MDENDNKILRVNMANIRRKIEPNPAEPTYILTELGVGYRMLEDSSLSKKMVTFCENLNVTIFLILQSELSSY